MAKKQFNIRLSDLTLYQIDNLTTMLSMSESEVVALAVERLAMQQGGPLEGWEAYKSGDPIDDDNDLLRMHPALGLQIKRAKNPPKS